MTAVVHVAAASRLHFGLLNVPSADGADDAPPWTPRRFGGVGLMIERPGVRLSVRAAETWSATGPSAERALELARRFVATSPPDARRAFALTIQECAPQHAGLGTGTQLGLAVAKALAVHCRLDDDASGLARRVGRGLRSSLGIHGFERGGFLVEAGKESADEIAPLAARHDFPADWQVLVIIPRELHGTHGALERDAFASIPATDVGHARTEALGRLTWQGMLPALAAGDLPAFGEAVYEFNRKAGEWFAAWQGGVYAHPRVAELVATVRAAGIRGVGQSSWGPAVFAIGERERLENVARRLRPDEHFTTAACNRGAMQASSQAAG